MTCCGRSGPLGCAAGRRRCRRERRAGASGRRRPATSDDGHNGRTAGGRLDDRQHPLDAGRADDVHHGVAVGACVSFDRHPLSFDGLVQTWYLARIWSCRDVPCPASLAQRQADPLSCRTTTSIVAGIGRCR